MYRALALAPLLTPLLTSGAPQPLASVPDDHFPPARQSLTIEVSPDDMPSVADVLRDFADVTGQNVHVSPDTRQQLASTPIGLLDDVTIPPGEVYTFVESLLFQAHCVMAHVRAQSPPLIAVYSLENRDTQWIDGWVEIDQGSAASYADHPALLVQTVVDVTPLDANQIGGSMRMLARQQFYQSVLPIGRDAVLLRGTGADVAAWKALLDTASGKTTSAGGAGGPASNDHEDR